MLVDDHALVRAGFRALLQEVGGFEVVAEARGGYEALALLKTHEPDIVLLDVVMKELNGHETVLRLRKDFPDLPVLMVSMYADEEYVRRSLSAGASGYLLKDASLEELEMAIRAVLQHQVYLSPAVSKLVVGQYVKNGETGRTQVRRDSFHGLTPRQREILQLIAEGSLTKEVAAKLNLSIKTVESHRTELMARLGVHDVASLVRCAIRLGLVRADQ